MTWRPLRGRVIVTRITQVTSDVLIIPESYRDERSVRTADRGVVLAAGEPPSHFVRCHLCGGSGRMTSQVSEMSKVEHHDCPDCDGSGRTYDFMYDEDEIKPGDEVLYLGPAEKLAIVWNGQKAYAVSYEEVLGVVER